MKLRSSMDSLVSCSGNCLATCERVLSGARGSARKAFALLIVLFLLFSLPVFAVKLDEYAGVISIPSQSLGIRYNSLTEDTDWGFSSVPASFDFNDNTYRFSWRKVTALTGVYSQVTSSGKDFSFLLTFGDGSEPNVLVDFSYFRFVPQFTYSGIGDKSFWFTGYVDILVDNELVYTSSQFTDTTFPYVRPNMTFSVSRYMEIVYHSTADSVRVVEIDDASTIFQNFEVRFDDLFVNNEPSQLDRIEISIDNIETSIENIEEGVVNIEGAVTDMKEQLEDSSSPIWSAAGEKIADTIKEVFVPSEEEMQAEKQELENLLDDKLGDAKVLLDQGETLVTDIRNIIGDMGSDPGTSVHFPGISLPMNGETYVIVPEQDVRMNNRAFLIFQSALGMGITVLCWWSILHLCEDFFYCLISGVSYWGFIRSRHDK